MGKKLKGLRGEKEEGRYKKKYAHVTDWRSWLFYASQDDSSTALNDTHLSPVGSLSLKHPSKLSKQTDVIHHFSTEVQTHNKDRPIVHRRLS